MKNPFEAYNKKVEAGEATRKPPMNPLQKWSKNKSNRKLSINAFCWKCIGELRKEITNCTAEKTCPLWYVRPYQAKEAKTNVTKTS